MVIMFQNEKSRNQLLAYGHVYTFRGKPRKTGSDWANTGRGTKKICDVLIASVRNVRSPQDLKPYVKHSGFKNITEWIEAIRQMYKLPGTTPITAITHGVLYHVAMRENVKK